MPRVVPMVSGAALVLLLLCLLRLGAQQRSGPFHTDLVLEGGTPATLYLPYATGSGFLPEPPAREQRPPAVVAMHGFASDRLNLSPLARSLALAGHAVLAIDVAGHGESRRGGFEQARAQRGPFQDELESALRYLRRSRHVDGEEIALVGHSMGAAASLAYASLDPTVDACVLIAGGGRTPGPHRPANALFVYAEGDPERIKTHAAAAARRIADDPALAAGVTRGDFAYGTAVRHDEVPGVDHLSIVISDDATRRITGWLDRATDRERDDPPGLRDPRLATAAVGTLLLVLVLPGLGTTLGRLAPEAPGPARSQHAGSGPLALGFLGASLLAALPLIAGGSPLPALSLELGDLAIPHLGAAGLATLLLLRWRHGTRLADVTRSARPWAACGWALLAVLVVMALLAPLGVVFHRLTLTPERLAIALASTVLLLPLTLAIEAGVRRDAGWPGVALSLAARIAVVAALAGGLAAGVLPGVVGLMLPILALLLLALELPAAFVRARVGGGDAPGSPLAAALLQAGILAWILAAVLPVRA